MSGASHAALRRRGVVAAVASSLARLAPPAPLASLAWPAPALGQTASPGTDGTGPVVDAATPTRLPLRTVPGAPRPADPRAAPEAARMNAALLEPLRAELERGQPRVRSLLVQRFGQLAFEYHRAGLTAADGHNVASVTKSVVSLLAGIARAQGWLGDLDEPVALLLPPDAGAPVDERARAVTLRHLLTMTAGWQGGETATVPSVAAAWRRTLVTAPGATFQYDNPSTHLLAAVIAHRAGQPLQRVAERELFAPLGIAQYAWQGDADGRVYGSHELVLRAHDLVRLGQMVLQRGRWGDRQVVPAAWIDDSTRAQHGGGPPAGHAYGFLWWVMRSPEGDAAFYASGYGGQIVYVWPARELVIVVTSERDRRGEGAPYVRRYVFPAMR